MRRESSKEKCKKRWWTVGTIYHTDDIAVFGTNTEEQAARTMVTLKRGHEEGLTLNRDKYLFNQSEVTFLGHVLNEKRIAADSEKCNTIQNYSAERNYSVLWEY